MKKIINQCILLTLFVCVGAMSSCKEEIIDVTDTIPPSQIKNVTFESINGGAIFHYLVPRDEDFLYVKAEYTLDSGQKLFKVSSVFSDSIIVEGLGSIKEYEVSLYSVDRNNNLSEPIKIKFTPLISNPNIVVESVNIFPAFSGVLFNWKNALRQKLTLFMIFEANGKEISRIVSSVDSAAVFNITGLESIPYNFSVLIKDDFGNESVKRSLGVITPIPDMKIDKSTWSFLRDELMPTDSLFEHSTMLLQDSVVEVTKIVYKEDKNSTTKGWNALESVYESNIQKFWDEIIDDNSLSTNNYFHTGDYQRCPFSYYIDLGKTIKMSRVKVWQRDTSGSGALYGDENVKTFELWISSDKINWERVRTATIIKPSNPLDQKNAARDGHEFVIYEDEPRFTQPFRYLEYRGTVPFTRGFTRSCASEITIYGQEL